MRQPKVSMVVPCYNKRDYVGAFLESVYNQIWDNIELILVNDGSTDGTREVIAQWEQKLRERGYDVVIIDQENQGVAAAVKNGLLRITGDYVCAPDCDDELYPDYVSAMAEYLEARPELGWCICDFDVRYMERDRFLYSEEHRFGLKELNNITLEDFVFDRYSRMVWRCMLRGAYLKECKIVENMQLWNRTNHEVQFGIPLLAGGGLSGHIRKALYVYNQEVPGVTYSEGFEKIRRFSTGIYELTKSEVLRLDLPKARAKRLLALAELRCSAELYNASKGSPMYAEYTAECAERVCKSIAKYFVFAEGETPITPEYLSEGFHGSFLLTAIDTFLFERDVDLDTYLKERRGRVIGCGAKGKAAAVYVPQLMGTMLEPCVLWDRGAEEGDELCGIPITEPNLDTLSEEDTLLILPADKNIASDIAKSFRVEKNRCKFYCYDDIIKFLALISFPQFFRGCKLVCD